MKIKKILANIKVNFKIYSITSFSLIGVSTMVLGAISALGATILFIVNGNLDIGAMGIVLGVSAIPALVAGWLTAMPIFRYFEKLSFDKVAKGATRRTEKALTEESVIGAKVAKTASK